MQPEPQTQERPAGTGRRLAQANYRGADPTAGGGSRPDVQTDPVALLLSRLDGARKYGEGWRANCPRGHSSKGSLSIVAGDDGRALAHCFVGCSAAEVAEAAGLRLQDLFPERIRTLSPEERQVARRRMREAGWAAALDTLAREADVVRIAAAYPQRGEALNDEDRDRLDLAVQRIASARGVLRG